MNCYRGFAKINERLCQNINTLYVLKTRQILKTMCQRKYLTVLFGMRADIFWGPYVSEYIPESTYVDYRNFKDFHDFLYI